MLPNQIIDFKIEITETGAKKTLKYKHDFDGRMTLADFMETMSILIRDTAKVALREEQGRGALKDPIFEIDKTRANEIPNKVLPFSRIRIYDRIAINLEETKQVLLGMYKRLLDTSPGLSGQYSMGHIVVHNNSIIARNYQQLNQYLSKLLELKPNDRLYFVNVAPYAGFLERNGTTKDNSANQKLIKSRDTNRKRMMTNTDRTGMVRRPNGVYFTTHRSFARRGFLAANFDFNFGFSQLSYLGVDETAFPFYQRSTGKVMRRDFAPENKKYSGPYVYPYIEFKVRGDSYAFAKRGVE